MEEGEALYSWRPGAKFRPIQGGAALAKPRSCKFFASPGGCVHGEGCQYAHDRDSRRRPAAVASTTGTKKILVSGLPHSLDSEDLFCFFEQKFGSVLDAVVLPLHSNDQSGRFGVVSFKNDDAVLAAAQAKIVFVSGRKAMIDVMHARAAKEVEEKLITEEDMYKEPPKSLVYSTSLPPWADKFRAWLPGFLTEVSKRLEDGESYPLCSLKDDFRATCGLEIDHTALGFEKLSDFIRAWPEICDPKLVLVGPGPATHIVLNPVAATPTKFETLHSALQQPLSQQQPRSRSQPLLPRIYSLFSRNIFLENNDDVADNADNADNAENVPPPAFVHNVEKLLDDDADNVGNDGGGEVCKLCKDGEKLARWFAIPCGHLVLCDRCKESVDKCDRMWRFPCLVCCQPVEKWIK